MLSLLLCTEWVLRARYWLTGLLEQTSHTITQRTRGHLGDIAQFLPSGVSSLAVSPRESWVAKNLSTFQSLRIDKDQPVLSDIWALEVPCPQGQLELLWPPCRPDQVLTQRCEPMIPGQVGQIDGTVVFQLPPESCCLYLWVQRRQTTVSGRSQHQATHFALSPPESVTDEPQVD